MKKKERKHSFKYILNNIIIIVITLGFILFFLNSKIFEVSEIKIKGNLKISNEEIEKESNLKKNINIFKQSVLVAERNLSKNSRIYKVKVERELPNVIKIDVEERKERYQISRPDGYFILDHSGFVLRKESVKQNLIVVEGIKGELKIGEKISEDNFDMLEEMNRIYELAVSLNFDTVITGINAEKLKSKEIIIELDGENKEINLNLKKDLRMSFLMIKEILKKEKDKKGKIIVPEVGPIYFREEK